MSQKRDPVLAVLDYFEKTDLPLARQALSLASAIVRRRSGLKAVPQAKKKSTTPAPIASVGD